MSQLKPQIRHCLFLPILFLILNLRSFTNGLQTLTKTDLIQKYDNDGAIGKKNEALSGSSHMHEKVGFLDKKEKADTNIISVRSTFKDLIDVRLRMLDKKKKRKEKKERRGEGRGRE